MTKKFIKEKIEKKKKIKKQKKHTELVFVLVSIFLFFLLIFLIYFFKNALFIAKDEVAREFVNEYQENVIFETLDPFVLTKGEVENGALEQPIDNGQDPSFGPEGAKVKIFYFSDLSCPFCSEQEEAIKKIYDKFSQDVRIIWKDYPDLRVLSGFSYQAARAVRCANEQDKFWDYRSLLKENEDEFDSAKEQLFFKIANNLKLNMISFEDCLRGNKSDSLILQNIKEAEELGISGIPFIYVNDLDLIGTLDEDDLETLVKNELEK